MANLKELRLRVQSLKNTKKITSAMKMVSASKLKKAKDAYTKTQPFLENTALLLNRLINSEGEISHPLLEEREVEKNLFILFTSDRGLCGSFNNGLIKFLTKFLENSDITL